MISKTPSVTRDVVHMMRSLEDVVEEAAKVIFVSHLSFLSFLFLNKFAGARSYVSSSVLLWAKMK